MVIKRFQNTFFLLYILSCIFPNVSQSQTKLNPDSVLIATREQLYQAFYTLDDEALLLKSKAIFDRLLHLSDKPWLIHYYIALSDYYLGDFYLKDRMTSKKFIDDGIEHAELSSELNDEFAEAYVLLSRLYGVKIMLNPSQSVDLGMKSSNVMDIAEKLESDNPRMYLVSGISALYKPIKYGGGIINAKNRMLKAIDSYEEYQLQDKTYPDWGLGETYLWLGYIAEQQDSLLLSKKYFECALNVREDYFLIKDSLFPNLIRKINKESK